MLSWIIGIALQYLEPVNCEQMNEYCWIELLVVDSNIWDHLTMSKEINFNSLKNKTTNKLFPYKSYVKTEFRIK